MMASNYDDLPIVFAEDEKSGTLRHVDEVSRGLACGCVCPACGQRLVARQGEKNAHSFAHRSGECRWAAEHVITSLTQRAIEEHGCLAFPALNYPDAYEGRDVEISSARTLHVVSVVITDASGRGAPDLLVTLRGKGQESTFAILSSLTHRAKEAQLDSLFKGIDGIVVMDYAADMSERRRGLNRHYDRSELALAYQDPEFIADALLDEGYPFKSWVRNRKADDAARESVDRHNEELERHRQERAAREREAEAKRRADEEERTNREREQARESFPPTDALPNEGVGDDASSPLAWHDGKDAHSVPDVTVVVPTAKRYDVMQWKIGWRDRGSWHVNNGDVDAMVTESADGWCYDMVVDLEADVLREVLAHLGELVCGCVDFTLCVSASGERFSGKMSVFDKPDGSVTVRLEDDDMSEVPSLLKELLSHNVKLSMTYRDARGDVIGRGMESVNVESRQIALSRETLRVY